jgi:prevent-host-death family protein
MKNATITEAKNRLSALLEQVRRGERVLILDRGVPVARLEPVVGYSDATGRLQRLERAGALSIGSAAPPLELLRRPGPALSDGASGAETLIDERRSGR